MRSGEPTPGREKIRLVGGGDAHSDKNPRARDRNSLPSARMRRPWLPGWPLPHPSRCKRRSIGPRPRASGSLGGSTRPSPPKLSARTFDASPRPQRVGSVDRSERFPIDMSAGVIDPSAKPLIGRGGRSIRRRGRSVHQRGRSVRRRAVRSVGEPFDPWASCSIRRRGRSLSRARIRYVGKAVQPSARWVTGSPAGSRPSPRTPASPASRRSHGSAATRGSPAARTGHTARPG